MKARRFFFLSMMLMGMTALGFTACGDDDDDNGNSQNTEQGQGNVNVGRSIVGKWNVVRVYAKRWNNDELTEDGYKDMKAPYDMVVITDDNRFEFWEYGSSHEGRDDDRGNNYHEDGTGTWYKDGTRYVLGVGGGYDTAELTSYDGANKMEVDFTAHEQKGSVMVKKYWRYYLERAE